MRGGVPMLGAMLSVSIPFTVMLISASAPQTSAFSVSSNWWDPAWTKRKPITITAGATLPAGYQVKTIIPYDPDMRIDYGDLRFLDNTTSGELSYWIENCTADSVVVWVKINSLGADLSDDIWLYYGNPGATSVSDADSVFDFWDDFLGTDLDTAKWTSEIDEGGSVSVSDGELTLNQKADLNGKERVSSIFSVSAFDLTSTLTMMKAKHPNAKKASERSYIGRGENDHYGKRNFSRFETGSYLNSSDDKSFKVASDGAVSSASSVDVDPLDCQVYEFIVTSEDATLKTYHLNGDSRGSKTLTENFPTVPALYIFMTCRTRTSVSSRYTRIVADWVLVRKYVDPEPTVGIGAEETYPEILGISASPELVDRKEDFADSGSVDEVEIKIRVRDNDGGKDIKYVGVWIRDNQDVVLVDNASVIVVDENELDFIYVFNPPDSLSDGSLGAFDVGAQVVDGASVSATEDYTGLGQGCFTVDDLNVAMRISDNKPIHEIESSGTIDRAVGSITTAENIRIVDNYQGEMIPENFTDNTFRHSYGLVSPVRLHHGDQGQLFAWARDGTLDGISSTKTYRVMGDNCKVTLVSIKNEVEQSALDLELKWQGDDAYARGSVYVRGRESFQALIENKGRLVLKHIDWITSEKAVLSIFDNADRPLWEVSAPTFTTDSMVFEQVDFSGNQDNSKAKFRFRYGAACAVTGRITLVIGANSYGEKTPDGDGYITWEDLDLPDNSQDIKLSFENIYDISTNIVVNCKKVENATGYLENTVITFVIDDSAPTIYYGDKASFTGNLISQAKYVDLKLQANLYHENDALVDNTPPLTLPPGESMNFSLSHSPLKNTDYTLKVFSTGGALMWSKPVRVNVKLRQPASASPADLYGTTENVITLAWTQVDGKELSAPILNE